MELIERSSDTWFNILTRCGVAHDTAAQHAEAFANVLVPGAFSDGEEELDDFLGQILHESDMLHHLRENMHYSAKRIREIGFAFKVGTRWRAAAERAEVLAAGGPEAIANFLYANRMGNGDEHSGDGYRYRGGGHIMITGLTAYDHATKVTGVDLLSYPEKVEEPEIALRVSLAWWEENIPDSMINDLVKVTKRVNGGEIGIAHRGAVTQAARTALEEYAS